MKKYKAKPNQPVRSKSRRIVRIGLLILTILGVGLASSIVVNSAQSDISLDSPASLPSDI
jgi:hypothetical protein